MIRDIWHMTCDTWHVTHGGGWTISKNFRSPALKVWNKQCLEDYEQKDDQLSQWINQWINHKGVCRTALATPGLLISFHAKFLKPQEHSLAVIIRFFFKLFFSSIFKENWLSEKRRKKLKLIHIQHDERYLFYIDVFSRGIKKKDHQKWW